MAENQVVALRRFRDVALSFAQCARNRSDDAGCSLQTGAIRTWFRLENVIN